MRNAYQKDQYIVIEPADLDKIKIESSDTLTIDRFVDEREVDPTVRQGAGGSVRPQMQDSGERAVDLDGEFAVDRRQHDLLDKRADGFACVRRDGSVRTQRSIALPRAVDVVGRLHATGRGDGRKTVVEGYLMAAQGLRRLGSGELDTGGGKTPGVAVPLAVAAATANPIGLVVAGAAKVYGEESGKTTIEGAGKRTAEEIAEKLRVAFEKQGWIYATEARSDRIGGPTGATNWSFV